MKLIRYDYPTLPGTRDFDRLLNEFWNGLPRFADFVAAPARIPADLYEDEGNVYARFELPGFKREELNVQLENSVLTVSVERKSAKEGEADLSANRSMSVPDGLDMDKVGAKYEDGVLTVTLPKKAEIKPRAIEIR
ncbi:MAG: Hsp20/alpha crystallin family protein [Opitutales bacterium]|jgi:HSP20 family protein